jgi:hypothetical protein
MNESNIMETSAVYSDTAGWIFNVVQYLMLTILHACNMTTKEDMDIGYYFTD